jgi:hypothetical protein
MAASPMPSGDPVLRLESDGAERRPALLSAEELARLRALADSVLSARSGVRVFGQDALGFTLGSTGPVGRVASAILGEKAHPVRAVFFDKTAGANWSVAWHQDRTIVVRARHNVPGFGPWSMKAGTLHVEPPFDVIARMITLRAHLDDSNANNAPLMIVPGSHRLGRIPAGQAAALAQRLGHDICLANAGDVWVYATPIVHRSERARIPDRRRVLHVDYANAPLPSPLEWLGVTA